MNIVRDLSYKWAGDGLQVQMMEIIAELVLIEDSIMLPFIEDKYLAEVLFKFIKSTHQDRLAVGYRLMGVLTYVGDRQEVPPFDPGNFEFSRLRVVGHPIEGSHAEFRQKPNVDFGKYANRRYSADCHAKADGP